MANGSSSPDDPLQEKADEIERLREYVDATSFSGDQRDLSGELSHLDQHPAEAADMAEQRARDLEIRQILEREAEQIREAQQRKAAGLYGICADCGRPIPPERLEARPEATLCIDCQRRRER